LPETTYLPFNCLGEGLVKLEEIEEAKRRLQQRVQDLTDANEAANSKIASLEKTRSKLMGDLGKSELLNSANLFVCRRCSS
jgi:hypothetical protein